MNIKELSIKILTELKIILCDINQDEIEQLILKILTSKRIFLYGVGRALLMSKAFAMRLVHLGLTSYVITDVTTPSIQKDDLLIICTGSGETDSIYFHVKKVKKIGLNIFTITAHPDSRIGKLSNFVLTIPAQTKLEMINSPKSIQPMANQFEQSLLLVLDMVTIFLMERLKENSKSMWQRHFNLE